MTSTHSLVDMLWRDLSDPRAAAAIDDLEGDLDVLSAGTLNLPEEIGPVQIVIDAHRFKRFAFSQDEYGPDFFAASRGDAAAVSPVILGNDLLQLYNIRYSASKVRGLHAQEELWLYSPVRIGEVVTLHGTFVEAFERRGQTHLVLEAEARGDDGRLLLRHRGIEMLADNPGGLAGRSRSSEVERPDTVTGVIAPNATLLEPGSAANAQVGQRLPARGLQVTFEQAAVYSRVGEYVHNVHNSLDEARDQGLRVPVVQGQQQVTFLASLMETTFGASWTSSGYVKVKFLRPVNVFDQVTLEGVVTDVQPVTDASQLVRTHLWTRRDDGGLSTVAWAECIVDHGPTSHATRAR